MNLTRIGEKAGAIPGSRIAFRYGAGPRCSSDLALLWPWLAAAAAAPIPPYPGHFPMPWVCPEKTRKGQIPTPPTSPQTKVYHLRSSHAHTQQGPEHKHRPVVHNDYLVYRLTTTSSYTVISRTAHGQGHSPTVLLGQDSRTHTHRL